MSRRRKDGQLTPKQERWFQLYLELGNGSEAYRQAYNSAAMSDQAVRVESSRLINHPEVQRRREEQRAAWEVSFLNRYFRR